MRPDIIIMLTHHDVTVPDAAEVFEQCKDLDQVKLWGFKNVGLPKDQMKALVQAMKAAGKTTFLEVVTYDEAVGLHDRQLLAQGGQGDVEDLAELLDRQLPAALQQGDDLLFAFQCFHSSCPPCGNDDILYPNARFVQKKVCQIPAFMRKNAAAFCMFAPDR